MTNIQNYIKISTNNKPTTTMLNYIINDKGIVIFHNNKPVKVDKTAPEYHRVIAAFDLPESEQEKAITEILNKKKLYDNR